MHGQSGSRLILDVTRKPRPPNQTRTAWLDLKRSLHSLFSYQHRTQLPIAFFTKVVVHDHDVNPASCKVKKITVFQSCLNISQSPELNIMPSSSNILQTPELNTINAGWFFNCSSQFSVPKRNDGQPIRHSVLKHWNLDGKVEKPYIRTKIHTIIWSFIHTIMFQ